MLKTKEPGGGTLGVKTGKSTSLAAFFAEELDGGALVSPSISAAFLIKSSSESELSTLVVFSGSAGGDVVIARLFDLVGMFRGIVFVGTSDFWVRVLIFGSISGIVRSALLAMTDVEVLSLPEPCKKNLFFNICRYNSNIKIGTTNIFYAKNSQLNSYVR